MMDLLKTLAKQPYWVIALICGVALISVPCITLDKENRWTTHPPNAVLLVIVGICLLCVSLAAFAYTLLAKPVADAGGLDFRGVSDSDGILSTTVAGCQIQVINGRIEDYPRQPGLAVVLPCNEYFDDRCTEDTKSALGAYVNTVFEGQADAFVSLMKEETRRKLGNGTEQQKTDQERAQSFGAGQCVLLERPLKRQNPIALVSTTTQRAGTGLSTQISCLFEGIRELFKTLADARITDVAMPILGGGHGNLHPPLALIGLLLAIAEAARYGQGGQRPRRVVIVVFKRDPQSTPEVDPILVRRALALISAQDH